MARVHLYDSHIPDEEAHVSRNPNHWDADNVLLTGFDFLGSASEFQIERIKDGEVDFSTMKDTDLPLAQDAADDGDIEFIITPTVQYGELFIKASVSPYDDIRVRQALNHAINRPVAAEFVTGVPGSESFGPIAPSSPAKGVAENPYPYDPERAKELLAEAGYPDGLTISVAQIEQAIMAEALAVPIYHNSGLSVFRPEVKGIGRGYTTCEEGNFLDPIYIAKD